MLTAEAHVVTERASDYLGKLCRHIKRVAESHSTGPLDVEWSESHGMASFGWGRCILQATPEMLMLRVEAAGEDGVRRIEALITERLETFGSAERLKVTWSNGAGAF
jgi:hypothetical protein